MKFFIVCFVLALSGFWFAVGSGADVKESEKDMASRILNVTGIKGGLVVHLGCGEGNLTAALRTNDRYIVHGLDAETKNIEIARKYIQSIGLSGKVSVEQWQYNYMPYAENMVNLLVSENPGKVTMDEIMRVLVPNGVAYIKKDGGVEHRSTGGWTKTVKQWPKEIDEWTHYLYDASSNAVSHDQVVGPPRHVQWIQGPRHTRSHEHTPSIFGLVSSGGRIFYIVDEASIGSLRQSPNWHLVARDAFNGILLWKRPIDQWFPYLFKWGTPFQLQRRLIAVGNYVYVTPGFHAPLSVLDATTGEIIAVYEQTRGTEEIIYHNGILVTIVRNVTSDRVSEMERLSNIFQNKEMLFDENITQPLFKEFQAIEGKAEKSILAIEAEKGVLLWKKTEEDIAKLKPLSLCAIGNRVFYQNGNNVVCLDIKTGTNLWSAIPAVPLRVVCDSAVICANTPTITALSPETGKTLWTQESLLLNIQDAFVINGSLWLGGFKPWKGKNVEQSKPVYGPYLLVQHDLATGNVLKELQPENPGHHHRCWRNKATDRYIIASRRGAEFIDLKTGEVLWHSWVRGVCRYGLMPSNGLLYAPSHACACYNTAKLDGFYAIAPKKDLALTGNMPDEARLNPGPAYSDIKDRKPKTKNQEDWPTYRHDGQRSGWTLTQVSDKLKMVWQTGIGGKITSLTIGHGKVFLAPQDQHSVRALDADSGKPIWSFTTGARVDSPPTLYGNQVIFGCADGYVYSVRADDGVLVWRFLVARKERRIVVNDQIESTFPAMGSVLIQDGIAYVLAGRSSYLDGGIDIYKIEPETGKILSKINIYSPDPETDKQPPHSGPHSMPGALVDILTSDSQYVYLRDTVFDKELHIQPNGNPHLFILGGFLDDSWAHRTNWFFSPRCPILAGWGPGDKNLVSGRLLVFNGSTIYGYGREKLHWSNQLQDGPYRLFALNRGTEGKKWTRTLSIHVRAMVLADKVLFVAGPLAEPGVPPEGENKVGGTLLMAISAEDGTELSCYQLDSPPVFDGLVAANKRLYLSTLDGRVICFAGN